MILQWIDYPATSSTYSRCREGRKPMTIRLTSWSRRWST